MGKTKKKYNWKARQNFKTSIDTSEEQKIVLELPQSGEVKYDDANPLVLPSKKRPTKILKPKETVTRLLSKKKRKEYEKIVERKKKKENRAALIDSLSAVQVPSEELSQLVSITTVQTKGLKRRYNEDTLLEGVQRPVVSLGGDQSKPCDPIKGAYRQKRLRALGLFNSIDKTKTYDPNVVGFESSSSDSDSSLDSGDDDEATNNEENKTGVDPEQNNVEVMCTENNIQNDIGAHQTDSVDIKNSNDNTETSKTAEVTKSTQPRVPAVFVPVDRKPEIQEARLKLPILSEEQQIMETINEHSVVVLTGETGSGKTTQVPQFLYEAGYARDGKLIGVTEPRRMAAISMSKRVGQELNLDSDQVSYLIRFEGNVTPNTKIKFMTDGVLLQEFQSDFLLSKYSVIILDEAHERSLGTDILMGLLSRIVKYRNKKEMPLKLIIMSATLRISDFTENPNLFSVRPPVIKVESRQFRVVIHFNKTTNPDYIREAFKKACKLHTQKPEGGILIFVTGKNEVNTLVSKLRKAFPYRKKHPDKNDSVKKEEPGAEEESVLEDKQLDEDLTATLQKVKRMKKKSVTLPKISLEDYDVIPRENDSDVGEEESLGEDESDEEEWMENRAVFHNAQPLHVLRFYSSLPLREQAKVFEEPPEGSRLCVVATNIAETSLTIPRIKYVVDTGKEKIKECDTTTGITRFVIRWTSKAAAEQRAGRAGRTAPGECFRLYSSAVYSDFVDWMDPEIKRTPLDDVVLRMKNRGIIKVVNFPFPTRPSLDQLKAAEKRLTYLGALHKVHWTKDENSWIGRLTPLGKEMVKYPVLPSFAKMLCLSNQYNLYEFVIAIVSALSVPELILSRTNEKESKKKVPPWARGGNCKLLGDTMEMLMLVGGAEFACTKGQLESYCAENNVSMKAIIEVRKIRKQLTNQMVLNNVESSFSIDPCMKPPSDEQAKLLRQIVLAGMVNQVARKFDQEDKSVKKRPLYQTAYLEETVQLHSSSLLYREYPEWIVYRESFQTNGKIYIKGATAIEPEWLPVFAPSLCRLGKPLEDPPPRYNPSTGLVYCHVKATFGRSGWELPVVELEYPECQEKYRYFTMFLLDGTICPKLSKFVKQLKSTPKTMIRAWSRLQPRTEHILKALIAEEVDSRDKLFEIWKTKRSFLLPEYQNWLPDSAHNEVAILWPPLGEPEDN